MTKEQILNGMSEEEFYSLYPTRESWEAAQTQMAYGGVAEIMGIPFGAGVILADGGTPYYGGPIYPAQAGGSMTPDLQGQYPIFNYGGYDSPFNYGQFPVMQDGGDPTALWLAQQQMDIQNKTKSSIPTDVKPTGTNQLNFNPFLKGSDIAQPDSMHTSPYNPNIAAYFKGNKVIAGPATDTGAAKRDAMIINRGKLYKKDNVIYPNYINNYKAHGGDTTSQGGNQDFLNNRNSTYLNYIQNNILKNIQQEEAEKVQNAFMQMENQYMQMGGNSFDRINPQNAALQNMYGQQMQQYRNQAAQDQANFREANMNLLGSIYGIPMAQEGKSTGSSASDILHQFAEEFGPRSRRTGLPLFPANIGTYYQMNKKDAASLAGLPQGFQMQGVKMTPQWGLGARTAMNIGNMFRRKKYDKTVPGWAPKAITFEFSGKRGYMPGEPRPNGKTTQNSTQTTQSDTKIPSYNSPLEQGIKQTKVEQLMNPFSEEAQTQLDRMRGPYTGKTPGVFFNYQEDKPYSFEQDVQSNQSPMRASEQFRAYGGDYFGQYYNGGMPMYQGSILGSQTGNPVQLTGAAPATSFAAPAPPAPSLQSAGIKTPPVIQQADESKNTPYVQGPQVQYDATKDRSNEDITAKATLKRKRSGIGQAIGQYAVPALNFVSSGLENKDYKKFKKKLDASMLADNTFMTSPLNATNRGDYDINSGMFRPDDMVPVQFPGYAQWGGFNTMAFGGDVSEGEELDLSPEEIEELRQQGYEIEYLD